MSAEAVGRLMPAIITLDDLAAMIEADEHGHRYETSTQGALSVVPPSDGKHGKIAPRLTLWLGQVVPADHFMQVAGIRIPGPNGDAGRIPDLTVWSHDPGDKAWFDVEGILLVIEIISSGSEATDQVTKVTEHASAGIPQYWTVARDAANTVTLHRLNQTGSYEVTAKVPLAWLLQTPVADHLPVEG